MPTQSIAEQLACAHQAARAGRATEAQALLSEIERTEPKGDEVRMAIGMCHVLSGNAQRAVTLLKSVRHLSYEALLALSYAYAALGNTMRDAEISQEAILRRDESQHCADDLLDRSDLERLQLPAVRGRNWGQHMRWLATGDTDSYGVTLMEICKTRPDFSPGAPRLRLRSGKMLPRWNGDRVDRMAVIFHDGHGDTFCFGRYLAGLRTRATRIVAIMSKPTIPLVARAMREIECVPLADCSAQLNEADAYGYEWALPWLSGEGCGVAAWLFPDADLVAKWRPSGSNLHVGIAWTGSNLNEADNLRSIPPHMLAGLLQFPGVTWHSLQVGPKAAERPAGVLDYSDQLRDFDDTAALIAGLDQVISVDTAVANLAGAMGKPVWVLVERDNDFRWGLEGDRTPWFPSARVFRQRSSGGWLRVIRDVRHALRNLLAATPACLEAGPAEAGPANC